MLKAFEQNKIIVVLFVDFTKAFVYIDRALLLHKLDLYGVRRLASYLVKFVLRASKVIGFYKCQCL